MRVRLFRVATPPVRVSIPRRTGTGQERLALKPVSVSLKPSYDKRSVWRHKAFILIQAAGVVALSLLFAACPSGGGEPEPVPTSAPPVTQTPTTVPTEVPQPTPVPTPEPLLTESLFLEVSQPTDESVVTVSPVTVQGKTTPDALVSVNGEAVEVDAQGQFSVPVFVEPGPNLVEVVASDLEDRQETAVLAIIYTP